MDAGSGTADVVPSTEIRHGFMMITKEILTNILKHAHAQEVSISIRVGQRQWPRHGHRRWGLPRVRGAGLGPYGATRILRIAWTGAKKRCCNRLLRGAV